MIDLKPFLKKVEIRELLSFCVYNPSDSRLDKVLNDYHDNPNCVLRGYIENEALLGCIGIDIKDPNQAIIMHIAVKSEARNQGIGKQMISDCISDFQIRRSIAETDQDAVDFYRKCGFQITNLGEKYAGRIRYLCERAEEI